MIGVFLCAPLFFRCIRKASRQAILCIRCASAAEEERQQHMPLEQWNLTFSLGRILAISFTTFGFTALHYFGENHGPYSKNT